MLASDGMRKLLQASKFRDGPEDVTWVFAPYPAQESPKLAESQKMERFQNQLSRVSANGLVTMSVGWLGQSGQTSEIRFDG